MLHEILLALSGHPSSLLEPQSKDSSIKESSFPLLSPSEAALLSSISRLARVHRDLRAHTGLISSSHPSTICRAVATTIASTYIAKFQQKIVDVESSILKKDASSVGAYNIVPLAGVVGEFDEWTRLMDWLWNISCFMLPKGRMQDNGNEPCSGAKIIDTLRKEVQTGYSDIEEAALTLEKVAETAWLRQMSTWVLYGRLPAFGGRDFFIQIDEDADDAYQSFRSVGKLLPKFVSSKSAGSILFIGKSLNHIRSYSSSNAASDNDSTSVELSLVSAHLKYLSDISTPISPAALSEAIGQIRLSLSQKALQQLLPVEKIESTLTVLQEFFLLGRGEFAVSLITEADERIRSRHQKTSTSSQSKEKGAIQGFLIKESEVTSVLNRTWVVLASYLDDEDDLDITLESARSSIHLEIAKSQATRPGTPGRARDNVEDLPQLSTVPFNDILLAVPTSLTMDISAPLDLFLTNAEVNMYSSINAYLLGIRRAHLHLADLWRQSSIRREHPAPLGPPQSNLPSGQEALKARRERARVRGFGMRKVWATCGAAVFLLAETGGYFQGEVIQGSWEHFRRWIVGTDENASRPTSSSSAAISGPRPDAPVMTLQSSQMNYGVSSAQLTRVSHDPESLSSAHRRFLGSIAYSILLTDIPFTKALRTSLMHVDELIAFINLTQSVQKNLDLAQDEQMADLISTYQQDEKNTLLELDRARKRVDSDMKSLVARLREIDTERIGSGNMFGRRLSDDGYQPYKGGGVDRLLMKLDFGRMSNEEEEEYEAHDLL